MNQAKPYWISKREVGQAYRLVKANHGAAGVDEQSPADFDKERRSNLYKIWNRMSSGSYFPPPVRTVKIPKADGGERQLGIPTVSDRIAQMVVKNRLEPMVEPRFDSDSYGYRPGKSALDAVGQARQRCWKFAWVVDLDIRGFFDNIDHELLMRLVRKHAKEPWVVLYIERWLKAPAQDEDGVLTERVKGTPQGGVISPLLANLFLHYAFDRWMRRRYPHLPFERYADDAIVHCRSEAEAEEVREALVQRMRVCKLELNAEKTKLVCCKEQGRRGSYPNEKFDFLGYTYRPRLAMTRKGIFFVGFLPAIADQAVKRLRTTIRQWELHLCSDRSLEELAGQINPVLRGWISYYGRYYKSELYPITRQLDDTLARWACRKYKKLRRRLHRGRTWVAAVKGRQPALFAHWQLRLRCGSLVGAV